MTSRVQQQRAEASNVPPADNTLLPGQLYVELADPMKLWAGTPVALSATQKKLLFDSTAYLKLTGGTMAGTLTLANTALGPSDAVPKSYVDTATGAAVPLAGGTMTGPLILSGTPTQPLQAAPKNYVDTMVPLAGGTMTGLLTLSANPVAPLGAVTKQYSDLKLPLAGGTMTGNLILNADPTLPLQAVTKQYIDAHPAVTVGDTPPPSPAPGALWWDSVGAQLYIRYQDPNSTSWVIANQSGLTDAPNDANTYGRHANAWTTVATSAQVTAAQNAANAAQNTANVNTGRNLVQNGAFAVQQRGAGPFTATGVYTADRWQIGNSDDIFSFSVITLTDADRAAIGDEAARFGFQNVFTGSAVASAYNQILNKIEGVRRLGNKTVTVSFWAKAASGTPKIGVNVLQYYGTGGSPSAAAWALATGNAVTITTTWARYSCTLVIPSQSAKTLGTNGDDFMALGLFYSAGSTANASAGNIGVQSGTVQLYGVQLEVGTVATPFDAGGTPADQLRQCQRFYQPITASIRGNATAVQNWGCSLSWQPMRALPTITLQSGGTISNVQALSSGSAASYNGSSGYFSVVAAAAGDFYALSVPFVLSADL